MRRSHVSDEELVRSYEELGTCKAVGKRHGLHKATVHERLHRLGVTKPIRIFTDEEKERLIRDYAVYRAFGLVSDLAEEMGRTVQFLSRQARALGLTTYEYQKLGAGKWKYMTEAAARVMFDDFKHSRMNLGQYCAKHGIDDEGFRRTMIGYWPDEWEHVIEAKAPVGTKYRIGRDFEYRVRDSLRRDGFFVMRSPASRSPIDLVAIKPGLVLFIQCKRSGALPPAEWNALYDLATACGAVPLMVENPFPKTWNWWRLYGRKDGSKRRQPMEPYRIDFADDGQVTA